MKGTVKSKAEMERLFQEGRRSSSSVLTVIAAPAAVGSCGRVAFIAGKKLGVAPLRSRCKRVMRAAAAELGSPWNDLDIVFIAKRRVAWADHGKLLKEMRKCLEGVGFEFDVQV